MAGIPEIRTETSIIMEAAMFTIDSRASERRATEPDMKKERSFSPSIPKPPTTASADDPPLSIDLSHTVSRFNRLRSAGSDCSRIWDFKVLAPPPP